MKRPLLAVGLLALSPLAASAEPLRSYEVRYEGGYADRHDAPQPRFVGWFRDPCAAKEQQLHRFQREAGRDGRYSKDEQRWMGVMQSEIAQCHANRAHSRWSRWY